jgi:hypothetical protein
MPLQSVMGALQAPSSKFGHTPIAPQPIPSSGSSSDVPHVLSAPAMCCEPVRHRSHAARPFVESVSREAWRRSRGRSSAAIGHANAARSDEGRNDEVPSPVRVANEVRNGTHRRKRLSCETPVVVRLSRESPARWDGHGSTPWRGSHVRRRARRRVAVSRTRATVLGPARSVRSAGRATVGGRFRDTRPLRLRTNGPRARP